MHLRKSLGLQIGLAFLIVALLPFAGISFLSYTQMREGTQSAVQENLSLLVNELAVEIERTVASATRHVKSLASNPILRSESASIEEKLEEMRKVQDLYGVFEDITLVDSNGIVQASTTYQYRGQWESKEWFNRAKEGHLTVSPAHVVPTPFKLVLVVTAPIFATDGSVRAVLGGQINMRTIWEIVDRIRLGKTGFVFITDKSGNLLACPEKEQLLEKLEPSSLREQMLTRDRGVVAFSRAGRQAICQFARLRGYQEYPGQGWIVGIIQDREEIYAVMDRMRGEIFVMALVGTLLILLLSGLFSRTILYPIQELNTALQRIARGDFKARVSVRSRDELGMLADAFNTMAEEIDRKTEDLDTANRKLNALNTRLTESNNNLQQFAYIASHDLQEPLRMVSSYVQLLGRRYAGKLDKDADDFISFSVSGVKRMQQLINDLLEYSRVGTRTKPFESVDCEAVMARVLNNLKVGIEESKAEISHDPLPTLTGDSIQLEQLFQNLIGNALKFCKDKPAGIRISAICKGEDWLFSVRDNGIGIEPQYYERIFTIFQRLHTREEYPGTGIGLAICKKIVQRHGGRIWVESEPGKGSTFYFTIAQNGGIAS